MWLGKDSLSLYLETNDDLPATSVVCFNLGDDLDAFSCLAENAADVLDVLWSADERREHDVDLQCSTQSVHSGCVLGRLEVQRKVKGQGHFRNVSFQSIGVLTLTIILKLQDLWQFLGRPSYYET